jgi:hypothetical protein
MRAVSLMRMPLKPTCVPADHHRMEAITFAGVLGTSLPRPMAAGEAAKALISVGYPLVIALTARFVSAPCTRSGSVFALLVGMFAGRPRIC